MIKLAAININIWFVKINTRSEIDDMHVSVVIDPRVRVLRDIIDKLWSMIIQKLLQLWNFCTRIFDSILLLEYNVKMLYRDCEISCVCKKIIYFYKI